MGLRSESDPEEDDGGGGAGVSVAPAVGAFDLLLESGGRKTFGCGVEVEAAADVLASASDGAAVDSGAFPLGISLVCVSVMVSSESERQGCWFLVVD